MIYTDLEAVREFLGVDEEVLPDAEGEELIESAEDLIDELLGARGVDFDTGRKVDPDVILGWQEDKLERATNLAAKFLFQNPDWTMEQRYSSVGGDQSGNQPMGTPFPGVVMVLNASKLRVLTTGASPSRQGAHSDPVVGNLPEPD